MKTKTKTLLLSFSIVCLFSCKNGADKAEQQVEETQKALTSSSVQSAIDDIPTFEDAETQKFVEEYAQYMKLSIDAYKTNDATKVAELQKEATEWATKLQSSTMRLAKNPDDIKKFNEYIQKLSIEMQEAMKK
jgi:glutaredoxin 2